jgi:hypothetical protein
VSLLAGQLLNSINLLISVLIKWFYIKKLVIYRMNAIEQELSILSNSWDEFIVGEQAILHWLINPADSLLVNAFIKVKEQFDENTGSWFIQLSCPFVSGETFGYHLAEEFNQLIRDGLDEVEAEKAEVDAEENEADEAKNEGNAEIKNSNNDWQMFDVAQAQSGLHALFASVNSVISLFESSIEQLTLVINPVELKQPQAFCQWWEQLCTIVRNYSSWPPKLKLLALDNSTHPLLTSLFVKYPDAAMSQTPALNLNAAAKAVAEQTHDGSDGAQLRLLFLAMNTAIGEQNEAALINAGDEALVITQNNQWPDMTTTVFLTRAGGLLNFEKFSLAITDYKQAQIFAQIGIENKIPGCEKLLLQALLFEGTALFLASQLAPAAKAYEVAALKAEEFGDLWVALEAWRMAAFVAERLNQTAPAWQFATHALDVGRKMADEERAQSTLGFVGQAMLRLSANQQTKNDINTTFSELLGAEWLKNVEGTAA